MINRWLKSALAVVFGIFVLGGGVDSFPSILPESVSWGDDAEAATPLPVPQPLENQALEAPAIEGLLWTDAKGYSPRTSLTDLSDDMAALVARVSPALVALRTKSVVEAEDRDRSRRSSGVTQGEGSGFIVHESGLIVTNAHVVDRVFEVELMFHGGETRMARVLGSDARSDLALLQIEGSGGPYPILPLGDSRELRMGEIVLSAGNTFGLGTSYGFGVLSGLRRNPPGAEAGWVGGYLQTDAMIKPGNSGGPLVNAAGEVVGIASAVTGPLYEVGLAIPVNAAKTVLPFLYARGYFPKGYLGIRVQEVALSSSDVKKYVPEAKGDSVAGVKIVEVVPRTGAFRARLKEEDIILELGESTVRTTVDLQEAVGRLVVGDEIVVAVLRNGRRIERSVTVGEMSESE